MKKFFSSIFLHALLLTFPVSVLAAEKAPGSTVASGEFDTAGNLIQTSLGLLVILGLIAVAAWLAKRFGNFKIGAQGQMKVIGGLSLGARERVVLLEVGGEQLLLGVAPGRIQTLHKMETPLSSELQADSANKSFADKLGAAMNSAIRRPQA